MTNIFDEFAIRDLNHHTRGQGLSLAIARHIVELHKGKINVESRDGNGAIFHVKLPLLTRAKLTKGRWRGEHNETKKPNSYN